MDFKKPDLNKPIANPMLLGTIQLMKAEDTPEHKEMFISELVKARFLCPVVMTPVPKPDENGVVRMEQGTQIQFPMLTAQDGKQFFMAFSDWAELKKWKQQEKQQVFALSFDDYAGMLLRKDKEGKVSPAMGFVINPFNENIIVSRQMIAGVLAMNLQKKGVKIPHLQKVKKAQADGEAEKKETQSE